MFKALLFAVLALIFCLIAPNASAACVQPPAGLVNWWPAEGNGTDIIGGNNGTLQNGLGFATGEVGSAFSFDGTNDSLLIGAAAIPAPWTAEFWVNRQPAVQVSAVLMSDSATGLKLEQFENTKKVGFTIYGVQDYAFNYIAPVGVWVHLVFVGTTTNTQLYVNGAFQDSQPVSISLPRTSLGNDIASRNSRPLKGLIDEVSLYNRALSPTEILALFDAGSSGKCNARPANDDFANAVQINGSSTTVNGSNVGATVQSGEPNHAGASQGVSVWWKWTAPSDGRLKLDANGSTFGTTLAVYSGSTLATLSEEASDSVAFNGGNFAAVNFNVFAGTTYYIAIDGSPRFIGDAVTGNVSLNVDFCPAPQILGFTTTQTVQADGIHVLFCANVIGNVDNYNWSIVSDVEILSNFTANACFEVVVAPTNEDEVQVELNATGPCGGTSGSGPPVTSCGICLSRGSPSLLTGATGSGAGPVLTNKCGVLSANARWFKMVATNGTGLVEITTAGSANPTTLSIYTGSIILPNQLTLITCDDGVTSNKVAFNATQNSVYWVVADPHTTSTGLKVASAFAQFPLTVSGLTANNRAYDATTAATLAGAAKLNGVNGIDSVSLSGTPIGTFADKHVGNNKPVSVAGLSLSGADAGQYTLSPLTLSASITPRSLTAGGLTANNKSYDGTTSATISGSATLTGVLASDAVSPTGTPTGAFSSKDVGNNKSVTVSGLTLGGAAAGDYSLTPLSLDASITPRSVTVTGLAANNKIYDGTSSVTISGSATLTGVVANDSVSTTGTATGAFATKDVGNNKPVNVSGLSLGGTAAGNYALTPLTLNASITPLALTVSGLTANDKTYDGNTSATISGTASLNGVVANDSVSPAGTPTGTFVDKDVGNNKPVTVGGLSLGGTAAGDYILNQPSLSASITPRSLSVSGLTANNKSYDGTTTATLSGAVTLTGLIAGDSVSQAGTPSGAFFDKNVGNNKPVTVTGLQLSGAAATDYVLTPVTLSASITPRSVVVTGITVADKIFDGTVTAQINTAGAKLTGILGTDSPNVLLDPSAAIGVFVDENVGNNILVIIQGLQLVGTEASNYALGQVTASGNIVSTALTIGFPLSNGSTRSISFMTATGPKYNLEFKTSLSDPTWTQSDSVIGDGTQKTLTDPSPTATTRFYRIRVGP